MDLVVCGMRGSREIYGFMGEQEREKVERISGVVTEACSET